MKAKDLRELTDEELRQRLRERTDALFSLRVQLVTGSVENVRALRNARRDIARIKTILLQRQRAGVQEAP